MCYQRDEIDYYINNYCTSQKIDLVTLKKDDPHLAVLSYILGVYAGLSPSEVGEELNIHGLTARRHIDYGKRYFRVLQKADLLYSDFASNKSGILGTMRNRFNKLAKLRKDGYIVSWLGKNVSIFNNRTKETIRGTINEVYNKIYNNE